MAVSKSATPLVFTFVPPLPAFRRMITGFAEGISHFETLFAAWGGLFKQEMAAQFESEGAASGGPWQALSADYATWKQAHYPGHKIGFLTGALMNAMTGGGGYTEVIGPHSAEYGMSDSAEARPYGGFFDRVRPVLRMAPEWGAAWQEMAQDWLAAEGRSRFAGGGASLAAFANPSVTA